METSGVVLDSHPMKPKPEPGRGAIDRNSSFTDVSRLDTRAAGYLASTD